MAPPTKEMMEIRELQEKLAGLEKRFDEMVDGFRNLAQKDKNAMTFIAELKTHLEAVKVDVANIKQNKILEAREEGGRIGRF